MKATYTLLAAASLFCRTASAGEQATDPAPTKPMKAEFSIYSGDMGDERAPTITDRKLAVEVTGQAAREIFDSIYPDAKVTCSDGKGQRLRRKDRLWCSFSPSDGYRCYFGFDLRTGKSIGGASC
jgi:hypothetical protein